METPNKVNCLQTHWNAINSPVIILGDLNVTIPQSTIIGNNWYKQRPFNVNSMLLYDFIIDNDLNVSNFKFRQNVNFTYFKDHARTMFWYLNILMKIL